MPYPYLAENLLDEKRLAHKAPRDGFGDALVELGEHDPRIVVLSADLTESTRCQAFKEHFPERFIEVGICEQAMASIAAGLALAGKIPFIASFAIFSPGRNWEQIRTNICLNHVPVKIIGSHAGIATGPDGASHQALEDLALTRTLPHMTVLSPADAIETYQATLAAAKINGPVYLRFSRDKGPIFTTTRTPFSIGRAEILREGMDVAILACGPMVYAALQAAELLKHKKITARVINSHTIKPLDFYTITSAAKECGAVVTAEDHQIAGGLGSTVAELLSGYAPTPMEFVGMHDQFGESGTTAELYEHFGLTAAGIAAGAIKAIARKRN